jgi:hypothetical protein
MYTDMRPDRGRGSEEEEEEEEEKCIQNIVHKTRKEYAAGKISIHV